jgi:4-oxalocrotonate tautomerase
VWALTTNRFDVSPRTASLFNQKAQDTMPLAHIYMLEGRTSEQKKVVIEKVTDALAESLGSDRQSIRVLLHDVAADEWGVGGRTVKESGR